MKGLVLSCFFCLLIFACTPSLFVQKGGEASYFSVNELKYNTVQELATLPFYEPNEVWALQFHNFPLKKIPAEFLEFSELRFLSFSGYTTMTDLPPEFLLFKNLAVLEIDGLQLAQIDGGWKDISSLEELYLNNNAITSIPTDFCPASLTRLNLSNNNIKYLPQNTCLSKLTILDISDNDSVGWEPVAKFNFEQLLGDDTMIYW